MRGLAKAATEAGGPAVVVVVLPLAVAWDATGHRVLPTLGWGLLVAVMCSVLPMAFVVSGARRGRWDGHHVRNRDGRMIPLLVCLGCVLACVLVLALSGGPRELIALLASMITVLVLATVITRWWKISLHGAVSSGAVFTIVLLYGPLALLLFAGVALICWSRVRLGDHTIAQVIGGALLGPVAGGAVFLLLR